MISLYTRQKNSFGLKLIGNRLDYSIVCLLFSSKNFIFFLNPPKYSRNGRQKSTFGQDLETKWWTVISTSKDHPGFETLLWQKLFILLN